MINLFTSYYKDKNFSRQGEYDTCLMMNINNTKIDRIFVLNEQECNIKHEKITLFEHKRPTYKDFIKYINSVTGDNDYNIIANSDIFFDESIENVYNYTNEYCLALSRYDYLENGNIKLHHEAWSQDTWIFKGKIKEPIYCDFYLGTAGCDNRIAWEFNNVGYKVINPALSIKTIHYHLSNIRNYSMNNIIKKPFLKVDII